MEKFKLPDEARQEIEKNNFVEVKSVTLHAAGVILTTDPTSTPHWAPQKTDTSKFKVIKTICLLANTSNGSLTLLTCYVNNETGKASAHYSNHMGSIDVEWFPQGESSK